MKDLPGAADTGDRVLCADVIGVESDILHVREQARDLAREIGFPPQDQVRIATAVSELARNALTYAGGGVVEVGFRREDDGDMLTVTVRDSGPGIEDVDAVLEGRVRSANGLGMGLAGTRRIMDHFEIETRRMGGTRVIIGRRLPRTVQPPDEPTLSRLRRDTGRESDDPYAEWRDRHESMMDVVADLRAEGREHEVARWEAVQAKELRNRMLSVVAHDLRSPLNAIHFSAQLIRERAGDDPRTVAALDVIERSVQAMAKLAQDLVDVRAIESGSLSMAPADLRLAEVVEQAVEQCRGNAAENDLTVEIRCADAVEVRGDGMRLNQALSNLLTNAIRHAPAGSRVTVGVERRGDGPPVVSVADEGPGIPPADRARLFEPFVRGEASTGKGAGLGLAIARAIVEAHGGRIWVEGNRPTGALFRFTLPGGEARSATHEEARHAERD